MPILVILVSLSLIKKISSRSEHINKFTLGVKSIPAFSYYLFLVNVAVLYNFPTFYGSNKEYDWKLKEFLGHKVTSTQPKQYLCVVHIKQNALEHF